MGFGRKFFAYSIGIFLLAGCGNGHPKAAADTHTVDSAAKAAADTIRASTDTSSHRRPPTI